MKFFFKTTPIHVLLFPAFTVLALAALNLGQMDLAVIWRPLGFVLLGSLLLFLLCWAVLRDIIKGSILAFLIDLFGLTYGHFYNLMADRYIGNWVIGTHFYIGLIWLILFSLTVYLLLFQVKNLSTLNLFINLVVLFLLAIQIGQIGYYVITKAIINRQHSSVEEETFLNPPEESELPDVYFIILDKYGRQDALDEFMHFDNSEFLDSLREMGFWIAECSRSNYAFTVMSLSSQLNMSYVQDLTDDPNLKTTSALIQNNKVFKAFEEIGYTTIAFDMGFSWGNFKDADLYFDSYPDDIETWYLDPFELLYIQSTIGSLIFQKEVELGEQVSLSNLERKAQRTRLILDVLPEIPKISGPKFVYVHIITPHPPYLFLPDGSLNPDAEDMKEKEGYPLQLEYIQPRILDVLKTILAESERAPIIILEGDHAFGKAYVTSNLLALNLPENGEAGLHDHITLVNVFPYIFNSYYGTEIDYLPDISYTHTKDWYESVILEEWNPACQAPD